METLLYAILFFVCVALLVKTARSSKTPNPKKKKIPLTLEERLKKSILPRPADIPDLDEIVLDATYPIKGMNFRKYNRQLRSGFFHGTIKREPGNAEDPLAIAVHNADGLLLGYLPAGNACLCDILDHRPGNAIPVFGFAKYNSSGKYWFGKVIVPADIPSEHIPSAFRHFEARHRHTLQ